jgi:hypothetical protein
VVSLYRKKKVSGQWTFFFLRGPEKTLGRLPGRLDQNPSLSPHPTPTNSTTRQMAVAGSHLRARLAAVGPPLPPVMGSPAVTALDNSSSGDGYWDGGLVLLRQHWRSLWLRASGSADLVRPSPSSPMVRVVMAVHTTEIYSIPGWEVAGSSMGACPSA